MPVGALKTFPVNLRPPPIFYPPWGCTCTQCTPGYAYDDETARGCFKLGLRLGLRESSFLLLLYSVEYCIDVSSTRPILNITTCIKSKTNGHLLPHSSSYYNIGYSKENLKIHTGFLPFPSSFPSSLLVFPSPPCTSLLFLEVGPLHFS